MIKPAFPALVCFLKTLEGTITEYMFIDATPMPVYHNLRERRHKVFKGLAKTLSAELFEQEVTLITKIEQNMKNILMDTKDKMMLMRRSFIETVFFSIKSLNILIHSGHSSPINVFTHFRVDKLSDS